MKKVYFLLPIIGCILFAGVYWNFLSHHAEVQQAKKAEEAQIKKAKEEKEIAER